MKKFLVCAAAAVFMLASLFSCAWADERIKNFDVSAELQKDATLQITERITVNAENKAIRRGITRSFPIKERVDGDGLRRYTFDVVSVKLDGHDVPFTQGINGYTAGMAIGNPKEYVSQGEHTYEIVYRTRGHVRFLPDKDEIYFNAIGPDNQFPIDKATFTLKLPDGAKPLSVKAWTGKTGETGADYAADGDTLRTTRTLAPGEAFTVAEGWKKGLVQEPSKGFSDWISMNRNSVLLGLLALLIIYLAAAWFLLYRKGQRGTVIPLFHAPEGVSPGLAAWMMSNRDFSDEALMFQADMLWLAINGWASMDLRDPKKVILKSTKPDSPKQGWVSNACSDLHDRFFGKSEEIDFSKRGSKEGSLVYAYDRVMAKYNGEDIDDDSDKGSGKKSKKAPPKVSEKEENDRLYGVTDRLYTVSFLPGLIGMVISLGIFWWLLDRIAQPGLDLNYSSFTMMWYPGLLFLFVSLIWAIVPPLLQGEKKGLKTGIYITAGIVSALVLAFAVFLLDADWIFIAVFLLIILLPCIFIMRFSTRLSPEGQKMQNELRGLKMYIETAEKDRLAAVNAPEDSVTQYEEILPYAVALGCGQAWQDRFDPMLDNVDYRPHWTEYDENEQLEREENYRRELLRRAAADAAAANSAASAIRKAAERSEHAKNKSSSGGSSSSSSSSGGSAGSGSGGGGVGGW